MTPREFRIDVEQSVLDDLRYRLDNTIWPQTIPGSGWDYGTDVEWLRDLCDYWRTSYDWRVHEAALNQFPQYVVDIDGVGVHCIHVRSPEPDATPLVLTHGWPSSFFEMTINLAKRCFYCENKK